MHSSIKKNFTYVRLLLTLSFPTFFLIRSDNFNCLAVVLNA